MALPGERGMRATIVKLMNYLDRQRSRLIHNNFMSMILVLIFVQRCAMHHKDIRNSSAIGPIGDIGVSW